ncbi:PEP-CTERM sorting domain-containing protein [Luteolibacter sp. SL250]|uniref:PEP-CTERM sorting domain-containing protein n=1 Tax=Luteolibacter sp. SL250 TaxID=2995170 RepID=UPI002270A9DB|nr:PEP-CTERM sorting domain-containing protein [Luteolibacter sp. SL250]WAC21724.1 PEP-CTERM sorting domain-containing protein [Luteolibacter sp. SL250]
MSLRSSLATHALLMLALSAGAHAVVIFNSDFTTDPTPTFALNGGGAALATMGTSGPGGSRAIQVVDTSTTGNVAAQLVMSTAGVPTFNTTTVGQETLIFSFDMAITSMSATANNAAIPRILFRNTTTTAQGITIGLGLNSSNRLILFAARGDNATTAAANRVDLHDFGEYSATLDDNDTDDAYVNVVVTYINGASSMSVAASQAGVWSNSGSIGGFLNTTSFSNSNLTVLAATGSGTVGTLYFDNMSLVAIPEPASAALLALGVIPLVRRRR